MENIKLNHEFFTHIEGETPNNLDELLNDVKINPNDELLPPQVCWQVEGNNDLSTIGTLGNFSLVIGKAKSRKSFFIGLALSCTTKNGLILERFRGTLPEYQNQILYFDTEQSKFHVQKAVKRVCAMVQNSNPKSLLAYGLRKYPPNKRLELIEHAIYSNNNVGFVVIDGIKDLISSINDEAEATMIASKLLKWTEERNIHIVCVLHQNKGDNNARGHIGSELVNKAETVISITKSTENKEVSIVEAEYCRDKDFEPFAFEIDSLGMPQLTENWQVKTTKKASSISVDDFENHELYSLLIQCFLITKELGYAELKSQIKLAFALKYKKTIGDNKVVDFITHFKNESWLIQEVTKGKYKRGEFTQ
jgi:hypothetical protein